MGYSHDEWTPLIIHEKMASNRDAQSPAQIIIIKQNSPRAVACWDGTSWIRMAMECACWWLGEYKLYHSVWEPPIMCVAWEISRFLVVMLTMKVYHSKYYLSLFQNRALAPLQIPASLYEGPIY